MDAKQAELAPWTAKIEAKKAEIAVANNEKSVLEQKAADLQASCREAETTVQDLKSDQDAKVRSIIHPNISYQILHRLKDSGSCSSSETNYGRANLARTAA